MQLKIQCLLVLVWLPCAKLVSGADSELFGIHIVDDQTGRGVPMVELRTVNDLLFVSDSLGNVAIDDPSFNDREIYFHIHSHGYEYPEDGFGYRGFRLMMKTGTVTSIKLKRKQLAERLYRVTGEGLYSDSVKLGIPVPIAQPLCNSGVFGCDSVQTSVFNDRIFWFWGDTQLSRYPLGVFHSTGATSRLPGLGDLAPHEGIDLNYFVDDRGNAKGVCEMPGEGPTWIQGLSVVGDEASGNAQMFAGYAKIKPPLSVYERGVVQWDADAQQFQHRLTFDESQQAYPMGHSVESTDGDTRYLYYCHPLPLVRVPATGESIVNPEAYEIYS